MSSIKFDTNVDEVRNMTKQWGYTPAPASQQSEPVNSENETVSAIVQALNPVINFFSMLAGAATGIVLLTYIAWQAGFIQFPA